MFGKLMNNYYYGKSGKGDYRKEDLPHNRWQLFWEVLRVRFFSLLKLNLVYMLCWLPAIAVITVTGMSVLSNLTVILENTALTAEEMSRQASELTNGMLYTMLVLLIPCLAITGPFTAGMTYVVRNWARDEHSFIWSDFKDAMKENWKQALVVSIVTGLMPVLVYICYNFYAGMASGSMIAMIPQMFVLLVGLLWVLALPYFYPLMITYKLRLRDLFRDAFLLAVARLPMNIAMRLIQAIPLVIGFFVIFYVNPMWGMLGLVMYYVLIGFTLSRFGACSYIVGVFDRYINKNIEGVEIDRGIYREDEDDDEEEDEEDEDDSVQE
ncbi:MAG: YesL family protein [Eubacteriales bacterium]|nr:YesL family protein [Eubacteriales bacterium]